ncbi:MAG: hypothetical protein A3F09_04990 [Chlamydiae bacterium RIFCSPHIGHO2_12_FULL_49_11]|nr:MAG: hypothetical protein A3F09_04990 [Chlamydiae bacterium RIFCSPHIGHO2_12_FULL_49_11]
MFIYAKKSAPIFSDPDFPRYFQGDLPLDQGMHLRLLEWIALPGETFERVGQEGDIVLVRTKRYPKELLYSHSLFFEEGEGKQVQKNKKEILEALKYYPRLFYLWGGNTRAPVFDLFFLYQTKLCDRKSFFHLTFQGVDCSGILYDAACGMTPRNTHELLDFGTEVKTLRPLDLVTLPGHVLIALDENTLIESRHLTGVIRRPARERLNELTDFQYRRWL